MAQKANSDFTAREALLNYGFARDDATGFYMKNQASPTQVWRFAENRGWERFDALTAAMPLIVPDDVEDVYPFGVHADDAPEGYVKVPYALLPRFAGASGLHPATHPECYEWIWPETAVKEIYAFANTDDREYVRVDGELQVVSRK